MYMRGFKKQVLITAGQGSPQTVDHRLLKDPARQSASYSIIMFFFIQNASIRL